jgi:hypothetical protein
LVEALPIITFRRRRFVCKFRRRSVGVDDGVKFVTRSTPERSIGLSQEGWRDKGASSVRRADERATPAGIDIPPITAREPPTREM